MSSADFRRLRLVLVEGSRTSLEALRDVLAAEPDLHMLAAVTRPAMLDAALWSRVDVVVCDVAQLPELCGHHAPAWSGSDPPGLVVIGDRSSESWVCDAVRHGAQAWVPREQPVGYLLAVLRGVARGETWIPPALLTDVVRDLRGRDSSRQRREALLAVLTARERDVLELLACGHTRSQIAERLYLSPNTVRTHVQSVLGKLNVHSSVAAVAVARRAGCVPPVHPCDVPRFTPLTDQPTPRRP